MMAFSSISLLHSTGIDTEEMKLVSIYEALFLYMT